MILDNNTLVFISTNMKIIRLCLVDTKIARSEIASLKMAIIYGFEGL